MPGEIDDQEEKRGARSVPRRLRQSTRRPRHGRDGERRDRVDLGLVGVLPIGEGEGAEQRGGRGRPTQAQPACGVLRQALHHARACDWWTTRKNNPAAAALKSALSRLVR